MTDLGWAIIGWTLLALGAAWVVSCLIRWPTRAARCPKCRYDMTGVQPTADGFMCTECGRVTRQARCLHRRPRRKRLAMLALLLAIPASQMVMLGRRPDTQWTRWVPTSVLVLIAGKFDFGPCFDTPGPRASMHLALVRRFERMWSWQRQLWLPSEVIEKIREAENAYLVREVWPEGESAVLWSIGQLRRPIPGHPSLYVSRFASVVDAPIDWNSSGRYPAGYQFEISSTSSGPIELDIHSTIGWEYLPVLPRTHPFHKEIEDAGISWAGSLPGLPPRAIWAGLPAPVGHYQGTLVDHHQRVRFDIRFVPTLDEAIESVRGDATLDDAIRGGISFGIVLDPPSSLYPTAMLTLPDPARIAPSPWPKDVGLRIRYRVRGPNGSAELLPIGESGMPLYQGMTPLFLTTGVQQAFQAALARFASGDDSAWDGWTLVVEGDGRAVLRETLAPKYWAGPLELPFRPMR